MPDPHQETAVLNASVLPEGTPRLAPAQKTAGENERHDSLYPILHPQEAPGDVPDIGEEFTTSGSDKNNWQAPSKEDRFLL